MVGSVSRTHLPIRQNVCDDTYSTETAQSLLIDVCFNWINTLDDYIDADVEFLILYQERVFDVTLH